MDSPSWKYPCGQRHVNISMHGFSPVPANLEMRRTTCDLRETRRTPSVSQARQSSEASRMRGGERAGVVQGPWTFRLMPGSRLGFSRSGDTTWAILFFFHVMLL